MMKGGGKLGLRMNNFYVEINSSLMNTMNIPNKFAKIASMSENIELEGPSGYTWHVKIERSQSDNTFALQSGWKEFVTANKIYENDILVFTFKDNSSFKVLIFDRSGCEKLAPFFSKNMNTEPGKESTRVIASPHQQVEKEIISLSSGSSDTDERIFDKGKQRVADFVQESSEGDSESDDGTVRKRKTKENRRGLPTAARASRGTTTGNPSNGPTSFSTSTGTTADGHQKFEKVNLGNAQKGGSGIKSGPGTSAGTYVPPLKLNMRKRKFVIEEEKSDDSTDSSDGEDEIVLKPKSMEKSKEDKREEREDHARSEGDYMAYECPAPEFYNFGNDRSIEKFKPGETWALYYDTDMDDDYDDVDDEKEEEAKEDLNSDPKEYTYPDPEFFRFDNLRDPTKFAVDQVWAVYDDRDGMPRFYARIKAVRTVPIFEIDIVWFEPDPDPFTQTWTRKGLPVATGAFILGKTQCVDELLMFSHALSCNKVGKRNAFFYIYPKKGEIWALFKDWNFNWCSKSGKKKKFDYEMVEVVSDLTDSTGFVVMPLVKINGFFSLFMQSTEATPVVIPKDEILRFSHNVPWYRTTGKEREGVPQGAFELDSVSLPPDLDKVFSCIDLDPKLKEKSQEVKKEEREEHARSDKISSKEEKKEERENHARSDKISSKEEKKEEREDHARSEGDYMAYECPASEFYNFGNDSPIEKFKPGQTWALYGDIDKLPKYYAGVKRVDPEGKTVYITWLEPYGKDATGEEKRWIDTDLPLGCGTFTFGKTARYNNTGVFSHEVVNLPVSGKKNVFEIVPAKTETWAVYKNWKIGWSMDDITKRCQYDLVRVSNVTRSWIEVLYLTKVADHRTVFKLDHEKKVMRIPKGEFVRFSHKIPAHRLSEKAGPNLSGCWELDPAALPESDKISSKEEKKEEREDHARSEGDYMAYECPASEFYNFGNDRSIEKFKPNQTWALYCDTDNLPKYYAVVKRVDPEGKTVYVTWLEPYRKDATGEEKRWIDTDLPLGCGTFIFGGTARYNYTDVFSHEVVSLPVSGKKNVFEIVPAKTETWAVYKNWKIGWSMNDITKRCQYDLVRVSNVTRSWIEVLYLTKVADHRTVFKLDHEKKVMRIPKGEFVRFSHKILAHWLSDKAGPNLSGCWELDPAALPESYLILD